MMRSRWEALGGFLLAALLFSPAWGSVTPQPGTLNYIEGQAAIGSQTLSETSVGTAKLATGQSLSTADGRAGILLTPGIRSERSITSKDKLRSARKPSRKHPWVPPNWRRANRSRRRTAGRRSC